MMKRTLTLAAIVLTASAMVVAQDDSQRRRGPSFGAVKDALQLTDEQVTALQENNAAVRETAREVMSETREAREALRAELELDNPNPSIVGQHMVAIQQAGKALKAQREQARESALAILNDEQKAKLAEIEAALALVPVAGQARALNLLAGGERGDGPGFKSRGFGGPGHPGFGGPGLRGPRGPRPSGR